MKYYLKKYYPEPLTKPNRALEAVVVERINPTHMPDYKYGAMWEDFANVLPVSNTIFERECVEISKCKARKWLKAHNKKSLEYLEKQ